MRGDAGLAQFNHPGGRVRDSEETFRRPVDADIGRLRRKCDGYQQGERVLEVQFGRRVRTVEGESTKQLHGAIVRILLGCFWFASRFRHGAETRASFGQTESV